MQCECPYVANIYGWLENIIGVHIDTRTTLNIILICDGAWSSQYKSVIQCDIN